MANNFERITKYLTKALDTVFATDSKTAVLENGSKFIDLNFNEVGYVKVMNILMDGLSDYYRANSNTGSGDYSNFNGAGHNDGYKVGAVNSRWKQYPLTQDRGRQFQIDNMDNEEQAGQVIANLLSEFLRTKVVPEVDAYRFAKIASTAKVSLGNLVSETPVTTKGNASEITHLFNKGFEWLIDHEVPSEDQIIFVSPETWTVIANSEELYKKLSQEEYKSERGVTFHFAAYEGRPIVVVPSSRFVSAITTGSNGWQPATNAKKINYMIVSKRAIIPIVKLEKSKVFGPDVVQDFDGYKVNFRMYHDVIIPENKVLGAYVSLSTTSATSATSKVSVALTKDGSKYILDGVYTQPAGLLGKVIHGSTAYTLGGTATAAQLATAISIGDEFAETGTADNKEYFALVDGSNTIIAISDAVVLE